MEQQCKALAATAFHCAACAALLGTRSMLVRYTAWWCAMQSCLVCAVRVRSMPVGHAAAAAAVCAAVTLRRCALRRMSVTVRCSVAQHSTGACVLARRRACAMRWRTRMPGIVLSRAWPGTALAGTLGLAVPPSEVLGAAAQARQTPMLLGNPCSYSYPNSTTHNGSSLTVPHGP